MRRGLEIMSASQAPLAQASRPVRDLKGVLWASLSCAARLLGIAWCFLRQLSGDDAYERYR